MIIWNITGKDFNCGDTRTGPGEGVEFLDYPVLANALNDANLMHVQKLQDLEKACNAYFERHGRLIRGEESKNLFEAMDELEKE